MFYAKWWDIKTEGSTGRLEWKHGDSAPKNIKVEIIDDDIYEPTEALNIKLSVTPHPNPEYNPVINPEKNQATVYIMGPNDVNLGSIGFQDLYLFTNEGDEFCIPVVRADGVDEAAYAEYECNADTARDVGGTYDDPLDFIWQSPNFGILTWVAGNNDTKCIYIQSIKDMVYEEDEDILCEITNLYSDYSDLIPNEGYTQSAITIKQNDDQFMIDTPWVIAHEGNTAKIVVKRMGFRGKDVSVKYKTVECKHKDECKLDLFAIENKDYTQTEGEVIFYANEAFTNKTIEIPITADFDREETNAFMFFIEEGTISVPATNATYVPSDDKQFMNKNYTYHIYESSAIIWIHGPNDCSWIGFLFSFYPLLSVFHNIYISV